MVALMGDNLVCLEEGSGPDLRSDYIPAEIVVKFVPVSVLLEGLIQVQLPGSDVTQRAQSCHIHIGLCQAEEVDTHLQMFSSLIRIRC